MITKLCFKEWSIRMYAVRKKNVESNTSPEVIVDVLPVLAGHIYVVRDDLLPGGTKQRAAIPFLKQLNQKGTREFVYASPFAGFAQVALAVSCQNLGINCTLFCERDKSASPVSMNAHEFTKLAAAHGARIILLHDLQTAEKQAEDYASQNEFRFKIPLGFDLSIFRELLAAEVSLQWKSIEKRASARPKALWVPIGSGTLATVFRAVLPREVQLRLVDVRVLSSHDSRIQKLQGFPNVQYYRAPELFHEPVQNVPPVPSNRFYDAKLWKFVLENAGDGEVWWNVAR